MLTIGAQLVEGFDGLNRAAVLPYIVRNEEGIEKVYFLLGVDKKTGEYTDFGGGIKDYETPLAACLREFAEESNDIFGNVYTSPNDYACNSVAIVDSTMGVMFMHFDECWYDTAPGKFNAAKAAKDKKKGWDEISGIVWVSKDDFMIMLKPKDYRMWKRIQSFYRRAFLNEKDFNNIFTVLPTCVKVG